VVGLLRSHFSADSYP